MGFMGVWRIDLTSVISIANPVPGAGSDRPSRRLARPFSWGKREFRGNLSGSPPDFGIEPAIAALTFDGGSKSHGVNGIARGWTKIGDLAGPECVENLHPGFANRFAHDRRE